MNKSVKVLLTKNNLKKIVLDFKFNDNLYSLNLESDDTNDLKEVFLRIAKEVRLDPLVLNFEIDNYNISTSDDGLFIETAKEYVEALNNELQLLENNQHLQTIRKFNK